MLNIINLFNKGELELKEVSIETLHELLIYNAITGDLIWKLRPENNRHDKTWNTRFAGKIAGSPHKTGYIILRINIIKYAAHRVCWAMYYNQWPENDIDHRDGIGSHNWIDNLRDATKTENMQNQAIHINNTSGFIGVDWVKGKEKWRARIKLGDKRHNLGYFDTPKDAYEAYLTAKCKLHEFQPIPREEYSLCV